MGCRKSRDLEKKKNENLFMEVHAHGDYWEQEYIWKVNMKYDLTKRTSVPIPSCITERKNSALMIVISTGCVVSVWRERLTIRPSIMSSVNRRSFFLFLMHSRGNHARIINSMDNYNWIYFKWTKFLCALRTSDDERTNSVSSYLPNFGLEWIEIIGCECVCADRNDLT